MYIYLEIINDYTKEVVKRIDVTDWSQREKDRVRSGISINLNHEQYSVIFDQSEVELPAK